MQTVTTILRHGYTLGDLLVRPAVVGVTGPEPTTAADRRQPVADAGRRGRRTQDRVDDANWSSDSAQERGTDAAPPGDTASNAGARSRPKTGLNSKTR